MGAVRDNNFFVVHGWMINRLGLKGNELQIYAIIYGFSQADGTEFTGNLQYLADWTNATRRTALTSLQGLVEKGLLIKEDVYNNGVKACKYRCCLDASPGENSSSGVVKNLHQGGENSSSGVVKNLHQGGEKTAPNNISHNTTDNIPDKKEIGGQAPTPPPEKKATKKAPADTEAILARYTTDPATLELLREWLKVRKAKRAPQTEKALTLNLDKLDTLAQESGLPVTGYLEAVIARGWAAFFAIKDARPIGGGFQRPQPERSRIKSEADYAAGLQGWG